MDQATLAMLEDPKWDAEPAIHDWRNYIPDEVKVIWDGLTLEGKWAVWRVADDCAGREEWE